MGPNEWRGEGWNIRENKIREEFRISGGIGNFDEIKRKGLFVSATQF